jgi:hypothetical protein
MTQQLGPCTQTELDAFEGLDSKSRQLFSTWVDRALKAEAAIAALQYEAGMYRSLYENAIERRRNNPMVPWELDCQRAVCTAPECECPAASSPQRDDSPVGWGGHLPGKIEP